LSPVNEFSDAAFHQLHALLPLAAFCFWSVTALVYPSDIIFLVSAFWRM
jgi:hypothetical protein